LCFFENVLGGGELFLCGGEYRDDSCVFLVALGKALGQSGECALGSNLVLLSEGEVDFRSELLGFGFGETG
jgi:hypothetical protein